MPAPIVRFCALLGIVTLLATTFPGGAVASLRAACDSADDACCEDPLETSETAFAVSPPPGAECCPAGCRDCFLRCCNGPQSLQVHTVTLRATHPLRPSDLAPRATSPPAHPRAIEHPPRR